MFRIKIRFDWSWCWQMPWRHQIGLFTSHQYSDWPYNTRTMLRLVIEANVGFFPLSDEWDYNYVDSEKMWFNVYHIPYQIRNICRSESVFLFVIPRQNKYMKTWSIFIKKWDGATITWTFPDQQILKSTGCCNYDVCPLLSIDLGVRNNLKK